MAESWVGVPETWAEKLGQVEKLFRARALTEARAHCDQLIGEAHRAHVSERDALQAHALYWAARCARRQDLGDEAMKFVCEGLAVAHRVNANVECLLRANLVHVLGEMGQYQDALNAAETAIEHAAACGDGQGRAAVAEAYASTFWRMEDWRPGLLAYESAFESAAGCGDLELRVLSTLGLAAMEEGLSLQALEAGHRERAEEGARRSLELQRESTRLATELGDEHLVMYGELNFGCSLHTMGRLNEAKSVFLACVADPKRRPVHGNALVLLGRIAQDQQQARQALGYLQDAAELTDCPQKNIVRLLALQTLVDAHESLGDTVAALAAMRRFHALHVQSVSEKTRMLARALSTKYSTEHALVLAQRQGRRAASLEL